MQELEPAYQHAFTAIDETLVAAFELLQEFRGQQLMWENANKLRVAPKRPEPFHVRAAHDDQLRQLKQSASPAR